MCGGPGWLIWWALGSPVSRTIVTGFLAILWTLDHNPNQHKSNENLQKGCIPYDVAIFHERKNCYYRLIYFMNKKMRLTSFIAVLSSSRKFLTDAFMPIPKLEKQSAANFQFLRPISILPLTMRLLSSVVASRLELWSNLNDDQGTYCNRTKSRRSISYPTSGLSVGLS